MAVSAADPLSHIPGFRDRLGERVVVPQQSGALLEYLYFCEPLATAPFFDAALKQRVSRLANFRHSSYCRVRRVQAAPERKGQSALVSAHVAGRRLAEVLDVAARDGLRPPTAAVLAVTKQLMAAVALLHDFGPDGFHGALGPGRIILAADGRIVVAEHVLGSIVEQAATTWSQNRLWRDFQIPVLADPTMPEFCRRVDVLQIGIVTLAMLIGRPIGAGEFPQDLPTLLEGTRETAPDGAAVPLRRGLRTWLERALQATPDSGFRTLLEAQKGLTQLLQDEGYSASSAAWDAFVGVCEAAASRLPAVVVAPASASAPLPNPVPDPADAVPAFELSGHGQRAATPDPAGTFREDPFGPWPVDVPAESAATLFNRLQPGAANPDAADRLTPPATPSQAGGAAPAVSTGDDSAPDLSWAPTPNPDVYPEYQPETLFEAPRLNPPVPEVPVAPAPIQPEPFSQPWEQKSVPEQTATSVADWNAVDAKAGRPYSTFAAREPTEVEPYAGFEDAEEPAPARSPVRIGVLGALAVLGIAAFIYAPHLWARFYEGPQTFGLAVIESDPPGANVTVDGEARGQTPMELLLRTGQHLLELQIGGSAKSKTIVVGRDGKLTERMTFPEAGARGGLRITTYPTAARVSIDGTPRGEAPLKVTDLSPGSHSLLLETPLGAQEQEVIVEAGKVGSVAVPTAAWIRVTAPYELKVLEGGRVLGTTGSAPVMVPPGGHHFEFVNQALSLKLRQYVDAPAGALTVVPLELPLGMMNLYADQAAEVWVDGHRAGDTPLASLATPLGSHEVVFRHAKYGEVRYTVMVTLAAPVELKVTFRK
jgi:hypothetical protein